MFSVIFEVHPKADRWDDYLGYAKLLRPELERVEGFIDNVRYRSRRRPGWVLSHSTWADEKALIRWRTHAVHHDVQEKGRFEIFADYHLRVGEITADTHPPQGQSLRQQRLDETKAGAAKVVTLTEAGWPAGPAEAVPVDALRASLSLRGDESGLVEWDLFEAILSPGDLLLLTSWQDEAAVPGDHLEGARLRQVRVIRDYGMTDRREAPQYYPPVAHAAPA